MSQAPQRENKLDDVIPSDTQSSVAVVPRGTHATQSGSSRIVGSQAKKKEVMTRQGTQKMKFVPTLPIRRKKHEIEMKQEEATLSRKQTERGRGRGRGIIRGRGGPPLPRPDMQMTASGPFAMGPALAGSSKRRAPRSNFTPVIPMGSGSASLGEGHPCSGPSNFHQEREIKSMDKEDNDNVEVYSDPDEGVQIVDMNAVKTMDWMAPESLRRERDDSAGWKRKKANSVEKGAKAKAKPPKDDTIEAPVQSKVEKNLANALDLSESEEEEEMDDLIEDFAIENEDMDEDSLTRQEKLYFFQFPHSFPTFTPAGDGKSTDIDVMAVNGHKPDTDGQETKTLDKGKKVSFTHDVKLPAPNDAQESGKANASGDANTLKTAEENMDGVIGRLEVHRSGIIKMRLGNGMVMDVTAATQPSFLQHAVFLDAVSKKMHVLGEVNRRFVVSPDVDKLLEEVDEEEAARNTTLDTPVDMR